jgi:nitroreductase
MATGSETIEFLRTLRQVRELRPDPLPEDAIAAIVEVGRWSGSAMNKQPWTFLLVQDRETLRKLAEANPNAGHVGRAALAILLVMDGTNPTYEQYDEARVAERMMLAAKALGIGAAMGWFRGEGASAAKELLGIPEDKQLRTAIAFGYPDETAIAGRPRREQPRKPVAEIVRRERYS